MEHKEIGDESTFAQAVDYGGQHPAADFIQPSRCSQRLNVLNSPFSPHQAPSQLSNFGLMNSYEDLAIHGNNQGHGPTLYGNKLTSTSLPVDKRSEMPLHKSNARQNIDRFVDSQDESHTDYSDILQQDPQMNISSDGFPHGNLPGTSNISTSFVASPYASAGHEFEAEQSSMFNTATTTKTISNVNTQSLGRNEYQDSDVSSVSSISDSDYDDEEPTNLSLKDQTAETKVGSGPVPSLTNTKKLPSTELRKPSSKDMDRLSRGSNAKDSIQFSNPNPNLLPSRNSGYKVHKTVSYTNKAPKLYPAKDITDAALAKRGLTRTGSNQIAKRASGANDPENITIVNLVENHGWKWPAISKFLNDQRVETGRDPNFTPNSCHNRYNRNAPLLFAAEGKNWTPIKHRSSTAKLRIKWNHDLDNILVKCTKEVESSKWHMVAERFSKETDLDIDGKAAAYRYSLI